MAGATVTVPRELLREVLTDADEQALWLAALCWYAIARPLGWLAWQAWQAFREPEPNMRVWKGEE